MSDTTSTRFVDVGDIQQYIAESKVAWVKCRTEGHSWDDHDVKEEPDDKVWHVIQRCKRCYTKRYRTIHTETGDILHTKYDEHPDGYLLPEGTGRMGSEARGLLRVARYQNTMSRKRDLTELTNRRAKKAS